MVTTYQYFIAKMCFNKTIAECEYPDVYPAVIESPSSFSLKILNGSNKIDYFIDYSFAHFLISLIQFFICNLEKHEVWGFLYCLINFQSLHNAILSMNKYHKYLTCECKIFLDRKFWDMCWSFWIEIFLQMSQYIQLDGLNYSRNRILLYLSNDSCMEHELVYY